MIAFLVCWSPIKKQHGNHLGKERKYLSVQTPNLVLPVKQWVQINSLLKTNKARKYVDVGVFKQIVADIRLDTKQLAYCFYSHT